MTLLAANVARLPFRLLARKPFAPPQKALILKPCCMSQVMLATPLLAALSTAYPRAAFDWAVSDWARPVIATNPRLNALIDTGRVLQSDGTWEDVRRLVERLRQEAYDTCFIPGRSSLLAYLAWRAGIPQRVGLDVNGRGFAHTLPVRPPKGQPHEAVVYLSLARALGIEEPADDPFGMEFFPPDVDRTRVTERLVEEIDWLGNTPLVLLHPGGGDNPVRPDLRKRWPVERFALLGNHLIRRCGARVLLVGAKEDRPLAEAVAGLMTAPAPNLAGRLSLGELGALCEVADLYAGNDAGPTHIAVAVGCPTLAIFGPSDPAVSAPYTVKNRLTVLKPEKATEPFTWEQAVSPAEAIAAAERLLEERG